jgi:hypothetical protein
MGVVSSFGRQARHRQTAHFKPSWNSSAGNRTPCIRSGKSRTALSQSLVPSGVSTLVVYTSGFGYLFGDQDMSTVDAEEAIYFELLRENDSLSREQAKQLAGDFIRRGRNIHIVGRGNGRQYHYHGGDPILGRQFVCCY